MHVKIWISIIRFMVELTRAKMIVLVLSKNKEF